MIEFNREGALGEQAAQPLGRVKIFGIGGVGSHCVDKMIIDGFNQMSLVSFDTRAQSLESSIAPEKILLGKRQFHGIGASGDPEVGECAAKDDLGTIQLLLKDTDMVFLIGALGGGTAAGALPVFAGEASRLGVKSVAVVSLPFDFEGKRKQVDARKALDRLRQVCECVIVMDHSRLTDHIDQIGGLRCSFEAMSELQIHSIIALWRMISYKNLAKIDFEGIRSCFQDDAQSLFGYGEVRDRNVKDALKSAFSSVLMGNNILLRRANKVLLSITGGKEMTMQDVQHILDDVKLRLNPETQVTVSASVHEDFDDRLNISVFAVSPHGRPEIKPLQVHTGELSIFDEPAPLIDIEEKVAISGGRELSEQPALATAQTLPESEENKIQIKPSSTVKVRKKKSDKQELIEFHKQKGRFEKTEATIVNGEDLDIPTFMRKKILLSAQG